jgi:RNA polymerase sigma-70 factor (ECF subfamily)
MRMGADPATADDMAQDAFVTAFSRITDFRGEGAFAGWIKKIAARHYLRRVRRRLPALDNAPETAGSEGEAVARVDLDQALAVLAPAERVCVTLCYGAGFSHSEAAEALEMPLGTVKSHVKRGLDKLRLQLAPLSLGSEGERDRAHV